jgi:transketolase
MGKDDRFILSKGHSCWGLYVILREKGLNPTLEGHPHLDVANGIHWTTGSEGHGMPAGLGMAFAKKKLKKSGRVFVLVGDGECQEGTTWESLLLGGQHKLDNLTVIMDNNRIQGSGFTDDILSVGQKMGTVAELCGWDVSIIDGHNDAQIFGALVSKPDNKPQFIIANTVKGKGVDFMENKPDWHSKWPNPTEEAEIMKQLA